MPTSPGLVASAALALASFVALIVTFVADIVVAGIVVAGIVAIIASAGELLSSQLRNSEQGVNSQALVRTQKI